MKLSLCLVLFSILATSCQLSGTTMNPNSASTGSVSGLSTSDASALYVSKSGDTMSGSLNLPSNGLVAGTNQLVLSGGNVGIGTTTPTNALSFGATVFVSAMCDIPACLRCFRPSGGHADAEIVASGCNCQYAHQPQRRSRPASSDAL